MWTSRTKVSRSKANAAAIAVCASLLLVGCNLVLGLGATVADLDDDGISDSQDNCPSVPNGDQLDSNPDDDGGDACAQCPAPIGLDLDEDGYDDGCDRCLGPGPTGEDADRDGIDDGCDPCVAGVSRFDVDFNRDGIGDGCEVCIDAAHTVDVDLDSLDDSCDSCLLGPPHDEDGDGIDDACDTCPATPDPGQADADGNGVGDQCAAGNGKRTLFDPFVRRLDALWVVLQGSWTIDHDVANATGLASSRTANTLVTGSFGISTRLRFLDLGSPADVAITARTVAGLLDEYSCTLHSDGTLALDGVGAPPPVSVDASARIVLRLDGAPSAAGWTNGCEAVDANGVTTRLVAERPSQQILELSIGGNGAFQLSYAEIVNE